VRIRVSRTAQSSTRTTLRARPPAPPAAVRRRVRGADGYRGTSAGETTVTAMACSPVGVAGDRSTTVVESCCATALAITAARSGAPSSTLISMIEVFSGESADTALASSRPVVSLPRSAATGSSTTGMSVSAAYDSIRFFTYVEPCSRSLVDSPVFSDT
jgi:hypothetical protein